MSEPSAAPIIISVGKCFPSTTRSTLIVVEAAIAPPQYTNRQGLVGWRSVYVMAPATDAAKTSVAVEEGNDVYESGLATADAPMSTSYTVGRGRVIATSR